jgi:hypothetical protein
MDVEGAMPRDVSQTVSIGGHFCKHNRRAIASQEDTRYGNLKLGQQEAHMI